MEFWLLGVIAVAAVTGAVLELLVARENYLNSSRPMSMVPQRALRRSSQELFAGTMLLVIAVGASLALVVHEHDRAEDLKQELQQLRASSLEIQTAARSDETSVTDTPVMDEAPTVPVPIQDRADLAFVDAAPVPESAVPVPVSSEPGLRVVVPSLNIRSAPNGAVIRSLRRGHRVRLLRETVIDNKRWAQVRSLEVDVEGWVSRSFIGIGKSQG